MKNIISKLTESITLIENNNKITSTTILRFNELIGSRAHIEAIFNNSKIAGERYKIIFKTPPSLFSFVNFSGVKWRNEYYVFKTPLKALSNNYLEGIIEKC